MAKLNRLPAVSVKSAPPGRHFDGGGLHLFVRPNGNRSWVFRYVFNGRRHDLGFGPWPDVTLTAARDAAIEARRWIRAGRDPRVERKRREKKVPTFDEAVERYVASHAPAWTERHRLNWRNSLTRHASPVIGDTPVNEIGLDDVLAILTPLWTEKTETASRIRQRVAKVLDACAVHGERSSENPARWRGRLEAVLPAKGAVAEVRHFRAMAWAEVPAFMKKLRKKDGMGARALEFTILTAARSGETRGATWDEIDFESKTWTIPAARMRKTKKPHRVPLSRQALDLLGELPRVDDSPLVFPSSSPARPLSDMTLLKALRDLGSEATVHGFRSSFRDWSSEETTTPREIAEAALSHTVGNAVETAYARSDHFKKRRALMARWGRFCASTPAEKVVRHPSARG
jgi:integrase